MGRRKKESVAESIMYLVAMLPWWGGVAVAIVSYFGFHMISASLRVGSLQPGGAGAFAVQAMVAAVASVLQYFAPVLALIAAMVSFAKRKKREALIQDVAQSTGADSLKGMSWREFELLVGESFRLQGYTVTEQGGAAPDGGVDLVLRKGGEIFLVQCKQWKAYKVSVEIVRELYGVMAARGAAGGFVVTSGTFTEDAKQFAAGLNVKLIDGPKLFGLIQQAKTALTQSAGRVPPPATKAVPPAPPERALACPSCGSAMVRRIARKGANAGSQFWGCSKYPACKGTR
jgi:restriction system protein